MDKRGVNFMKIRTGFVSNSSSSSYTCDYCGNVESGYDMGLSDFDLVECTNGHICCCQHLTTPISDIKVVQEYLKNKPHYQEKDRRYIESQIRYGLPSQFCPMCNLEAIGINDLLDYYNLRFGLSEDEILDDIKDTFGSYEAFAKACGRRR
jgi:hypothetical protein